MPDALSADTTLAPPRRLLRVGQRVFTADGLDRGLTALLTTASWLLGRLPGLVVEEQRGALVDALAGAQPLGGSADGRREDQCRRAAFARYTCRNCRPPGARGRSVVAGGLIVLDGGASRFSRRSSGKGWSRASTTCSSSAANTRRCRR